MESLAVLMVLITLVMLIGGVFGWVSFFKLRRLESAFARLESRLAERERPDGAASVDVPSRPARPAQDPELAGRARPASRPGRDDGSQRDATPQPRQVEGSTRYTSARARPSAGVEGTGSSGEPADLPTPFGERLVENLRRNWMIWLGGVSVGLAGVFLVAYGIERGLLGPQARIAAGVIAGLLLHAAAEWLRRRTGSAHPAFAALAGGASITLYAAVFAALELYTLLSPGGAFALLALISLVTMALSLVHGPVLAIIGILGAYAVPVLVSTGSGNMLVALIYSLIITLAAAFLLRYVYRTWLWLGMLAGAYGWWLLSMASSDADGARGLYLAAVVYVALAVPVLDWLLQRASKGGDPGTERIAEVGSWLLDAVQLTVLIGILAYAFSIAAAAEFAGSAVFPLGPALMEWTPLIVVVLSASRVRAQLRLAPWVLLLAACSGWLAASIGTTGGFRQPQGSEFGVFALAMALVFSAGSWLAGRALPRDHLRSSLVWLSPVLWLTLAYLLVTDLSKTWEWSLATLGLGLAYGAFAGLRLERKPGDALTVWPLLGGHVAYSLAAAMFFREATLTLALAVQLVSLAWLYRRFGLAALVWIIKAVLALVVVRLTLNPWLASYPADVHWSLWTYGGATLCCFVAARVTSRELALRRWLEAGALHLLVLFLGAEVRYRLYDGQIFVEEISLVETALYSVLFGALALSYYRRGIVSAHLGRFYMLASRVLMCLALGAYALSLTFMNPLWGEEPVVGTPLWNILLLAYGAPVLVAIAACLFYDPRFRRLAASVAGFGLFVFVSLEIRHLWQGALDIALPTSDAESYTYSATWMLMAVATILGATRLGLREGYRAGMALLIVVIAKIFLIDMAGLEGLLRVASFMGLGLALLGLAYLYQRIAKQAA